MSEYQNLLIEIKNATLLITINRERSMNSLSTDTIKDLQNAFDEYENKADIRCVILTGAGGKAFIAGADIAELAELDIKSGQKFSKRGLKLMRTIQDFPWPVIAAINGYALGGGCELAQACDIRLASANAKLGQPEVNLGVMTGFGGSQRLPRLVGRGKATQLILTGEMISAQEAHRISLVDEVYPPEELMPKALAMAELIASKAPLAIKFSKYCINKGLEESLVDGCELEEEKFGEVCGTSDKIEGTRAFLEKRKPNFTNS
ncbi:MAG: enoyl-CoA hydratase/isomerase family protein [Candidatus Zixiibacteriota bacterium]